MSAIDRDLIEQLLQDTAFSYREIGRQAGCSDWSVRRVARELEGDAPQTFDADKRIDYADASADVYDDCDQSEDAFSGTGWSLAPWVFIGVTLLIIGTAIYFGYRNSTDD